MEHGAAKTAHHARSSDPWIFARRSWNCSGSKGWIRLYPAGKTRGVSGDMFAQDGVTMRSLLLIVAFVLVLSGAGALPQSPHGIAPAAAPSRAPPAPFQRDHSWSPGAHPEPGQLLSVATRVLVRVVASLMKPLAFLLEPLIALAGAGERLDVEGELPEQSVVHHGRKEPPWTEFVAPTAPRESDLVVPSKRFESIKDAVEAAGNGQRVRALASLVPRTRPAYVPA